ncbi:methylaspartate mutase [Kitasatospora sp. NPDC059327]|uniref:methylaspartate mutase n=1 Tax=Kitasatospora sp. NPDC059327 TaxID=3346803 RepID=UPI00368B1C9F
MNGTLLQSSGNDFCDFIHERSRAGELVVQPRMGFSAPERMRAGLEAVLATRATTVGTITVDSYTRVGDHGSAREALRTGVSLNGYPLVEHGAEVNRQLLADLAGPDFPVQLRHGSALPLQLFEAMLAAGLTASEGGPVSYCLPYSRTPVAEATRAWADSCELLARRAPAGQPVHLESFGGCMLGQLCPPGLLVALSVLECLFFVQHGIGNVSLSYAQQTNPVQDLAALRAMRRLAAEFLGTVRWHVVLYTYMGVFPRTAAGALRLLEDSVRLARASGAERLVTKTAVEAQRIPTVEENIEALELAGDVAGRPDAAAEQSVTAEEEAVHLEARTLVEATLSLHHDVGEALVRAFRQGLLDVPYCLHPDNANLARTLIDGTGRLQWQRTGRMPIAAASARTATGSPAFELLNRLSYIERRYDGELPGPARQVLNRAG